VAASIVADSAASAEVGVSAGWVQAARARAITELAVRRMLERDMVFVSGLQGRVGGGQVAAMACVSSPLAGAARPCVV
jgi:hypothetical protein